MAHRFVQTAQQERSQALRHLLRVLTVLLVVILSLVHLFAHFAHLENTLRQVRQCVQTALPAPMEMPWGQHNAQVALLDIILIPVLQTVPLAKLVIIALAVHQLVCSVQVGNSPRQGRQNVDHVPQANMLPVYRV